MGKYEADPTGKSERRAYIERVERETSHLPRRQRRKARMREFDRSGIVESDVYRNALTFVGGLGALGLLVGTYRALTSSPSKDTGAFILALILIGFGLFFTVILLNGIRTRRKSKRSPNGTQGPQRQVKVGVRLGAEMVARLPYFFLRRYQPQ